jgi:hypothetical protein
LVDHEFLSSFKISFQIRIHAALPYSIMGAICLQAAVLGLFLPETKGTPTLETMDDMNKNQGVALSVNSNDKAVVNENNTEL